MTVTITAPALPGVTFFSRQAALEHCSHALEVEQVRQAFENDRDEITFRDEMSALGFDISEIESAIADPSARPAAGYY